MHITQHRKGLGKGPGGADPILPDQEELSRVG